MFGYGEQGGGMSNMGGPTGRAGGGGGHGGYGQREDAYRDFGPPRDYGRGPLDREMMDRPPADRLSLDRAPMEAERFQYERERERDFFREQPRMDFRPDRMPLPFGGDQGGRGGDAFREDLRLGDRGQGGFLGGDRPFHADERYDDNRSRYAGRDPLDGRSRPRSPSPPRRDYRSPSPARKNRYSPSDSMFPSRQRSPSPRPAEGQLLSDLLTPSFSHRPDRGRDFEYAQQQRHRMPSPPRIQQDQRGAYEYSARAPSPFSTRMAQRMPSPTSLRQGVSPPRFRLPSPRLAERSRSRSRSNLRRTPSPARGSSSQRLRSPPRQTRSPPPPQRSPLRRFEDSHSQYRDEPRGERLPEPRVFGLEDFPGRDLLPAAQPSQTVRQGPPRAAAAETVDKYGLIKEYVNDEFGVVELPRTPEGDYPVALFHTSAIFVPNPFGNPYGPPARFSEVSSRRALSLQKELPIGTKVMVHTMPISSRFVAKMVVAMWPKSTENPEEMTPRVDPMLLLDKFHRLVGNLDNLVMATICELTPKQLGSPVAVVWEIKDESFGIIELKYRSPFPARFFALFHRDDVYLKDGKRAIEHEFFRDKPLNVMVTVGQQVTLSARSIVGTKGFGLKSAVLELQAVVVSLNPTYTPFSAPRASRIFGGPGTYGECAEYTHVYFQHDLRDGLNKKLVDFLRVSGKQYPDLDPQCLVLSRADGRSDANAGSKVAAANVKHETRFPEEQQQPEQQQSGLTSSLFAKLSNSNAVVRELLSDHSGILENTSKSWMCFFTADHVLLPPGKRMKDALYAGCKVQVNAALIDAKRKIQYLASLVWTKNDFPDQQLIGKDRDINQGLLQKYFDVNEIFAYDEPSAEQAAPPPPQQQKEPPRLGSGGSGNNSNSGGSSNRSSPPEYYNVQEGVVHTLLDTNFGLIRVANTLTLFDVCDLWLEPNVSASKAGKVLQDLVRTGSTVLFHAALISEKSKIQYLASSVWLKDNRLFADRNTPRAIERKNIHQDKLNIYESVVKAVSASIPSFTEKASEPREQQSKSKTGGDKEVLLGKYGEIKAVFVDDGVSSSSNRSVSFFGGIIKGDHNMIAFFLTEHCHFQAQPAAGMKIKFNALPVKNVPRADRIGFVALSVYMSGLVDEVASNVNLKYNTAVSRLIDVATALGRDSQLLKDPANPPWPVVSLVKMPQQQPQQTPSQSRSQSAAVPEVIESTGYFKCMITDKAGLLEDCNRPGSYCYFEKSDLNVEGFSELSDIAHLASRANKSALAFVAVKSDSPNIQYIAHYKGVLASKLPNHMHKYAKIVQVQRAHMVAADANKKKRFEEAEVKFLNGQFMTEKDLKPMDEAPSNLVQQKGLVKKILNENFALIYGPFGGNNKTYCLFDTYDLHIENGVSAAEKGLTVSQVLLVGAEVMYNACLMDTGKKLVPYLATAVWKPNSGVTPITPLFKNVIQGEKIKIYNQVVDSCEPLLKQQLDTEESKAKMAKAPVLRRDLEDYNVSGQFSGEKDQTFGFVILSSGEKALLHTDRVWIKDQIKFNGWRPLQLDFFKTLNITAREVKGFSDFKYQVIFSHTGMYHRDKSSKRFKYSPNMSAWIDSKCNLADLEKELNAYKTLYGH